MTGGTWSTLDNIDYTLQNSTANTFELVNVDNELVDGTGLGTFSSGTITLTNPTYRVAAVSTNTFQLTDSSGTLVDGTSLGTFTSATITASNLVDVTLIATRVSQGVK